MNILANLIHIYQSEHYDAKRFLSFAYKNWQWWNLSKRQVIDWTLRAKLIFSFVLVLALIDVLLGYWWIQSLFVSVVDIALWIILMPFAIVFIDYFISPAINYQKNKIFTEAKDIIKNAKRDGLITIGITGSYGKTTTKQVLVNILKEDASILYTPGNINTDIGIANFIIKNKKELLDTKYFVAEVSAYTIGEIAHTCSIILPDYSITTAIAPVHLERFGSLKNIQKAKLELANATQKYAIFNTCNTLLSESVDTYFTGLAKTLNVCADNHSTNILYLDTYSGTTYTYADSKDTAWNIETKLVAPYAPQPITTALELAQILKIDKAKILKGIKLTTPEPHRLEIIHNKELNRTIIDDSYNGNYDGFIAGIELLQRSHGRKIVLTPGIVELGEKSTEIHTKLAKIYIQKTDLVLLIKSNGTSIVQKYFDIHNFTNYKIYNSAQEAHADLPNMLQSKDTIIFQNDLSDNYN